MNAVHPVNAEQAELAELYRRHWPGLCRYLRSMFGSGPPTPDDIAQAAFSNLMALHDLRYIRNPRAFLYRTAHNIAIRQHERERAAHLLSQPLGPAALDSADEIDPERILIAKERYRLLNEVLHAMPAQCRRMLILNRLHGLSYAEISRRTRVSQTQVKRLVARALLDCKRKLDLSGTETGVRGMQG